MHLLFAIVTCLFSLGVTAQPTEYVKRQSSDPAFSLPSSTYTNAITCPNGVKGAKGGIVLLVHGTGSTGSESWAGGPYVKLLPTDSNGPGFDVCYIDLPNRSLGDAQVSGEYVAYAIENLAAQSSTGKVSVITHSQGGLNMQWAVTFWSSARSKVASFVGLAPDFRGTNEGPLACTSQELLSGGCAASVLQQSVGSHYLAAQMAVGGSALVPTTSLYTQYDEIIQNEIVNPISSYLQGSTLIPLQSPTVCTAAHVADHFDMVIDAAAYGLALNALKNGVANVGQFNQTACLGDYNTAGSVQQNFANLPGSLKGAVLDILAVSTAATVKQEPELDAYVCKAGYQGTCKSS